MSSFDEFVGHLTTSEKHRHQHRGDQPRESGAGGSRVTSDGAASNSD
jgi:hypothetical protein